MTVKPDPPPQVEVGRAGLGPAAASSLFQLFATQTLPAGSMDTSVTIWMVPLWKMWMTSPAFVPGGCPAVLSPASNAAERPHMLPTQTSSLPSMFKPHGMLSASFGCGVRKSMLLATQTFSFESRARARTPIPARKLSTLVGSLAGKRTTVSDEELATQTRF